MNAAHYAYSILSALHLAAACVLLTLDHTVAGSVCLVVSVLGWTLLAFMLIAESVNRGRARSVPAPE